MHYIQYKAIQELILLSVALISVDNRFLDIKHVYGIYQHMIVSGLYMYRVSFKEMQLTDQT